MRYRLLGETVDANLQWKKSVSTKDLCTRKDKKSWMPLVQRNTHEDIEESQALTLFLKISNPIH